MGNVFGEEIYSGAVSLAQYAKFISYTDCSFFGVAHPDNALYHCREIWTQAQRDDIGFYLGQAESMLEDEIGYPLTPKWFTNEEHPYTIPLLTKMGHLIASGVKKCTVITAGVIIDFTLDPATVTVVSAITDFTSIHVYYPSTDLEITPANIVRSGANIIISIPWCRLVDYDNLDNPQEGWDYNDPTIYETTVDVKFCVNDISTQATIIVPHSCSATCLACGCKEYAHTGCQYIHDAEIGKLDVFSADYAHGVWTTSCECIYPDGKSKVKINYQAGEPKLSRLGFSAIIRLAHSLMATEPCGCDITQRLWKRDRNIPQIVTAERINCSFGISDGAWAAWMYAQSMKLLLSGILGESVWHLK